MMVWLNLWCIFFCYFITINMNLSLVTIAVQNTTLSIIMHYSHVSIPSAWACSAALDILLSDLLKGSIPIKIALIHSSIIIPRPSTTLPPYLSLPSFFVFDTSLETFSFNPPLYQPPITPQHEHSLASYYPRHDLDFALVKTLDLDFTSVWLWPRLHISLSHRLCIVNQIFFGQPSAQGQLPAITAQIPTCKVMVQLSLSQKAQQSFYKCWNDVTSVFKIYECKNVIILQQSGLFPLTRQCSQAPTHPPDVSLWIILSCLYKGSINIELQSDSLSYPSTWQIRFLAHVAVG